HVTVSGGGTYTYEEWEPNWVWVPNLVEETYIDPRTGQTETVLVDRGAMVDKGRFVTKTAPWSTTDEEKHFIIQGGHEYVHPVTDYDN
ncbi:MAG: hypothetical protein ACM3XM_11055, partial [Mycobacterium leprae]